MKDLTLDEKNIVISTGILVICFIIIGLLTKIGRDNIYANYIEVTIPRGIDKTMVYQIEDVYEEGDDWIVKGITFLTDANSQDVEWKLQLINMDNNKNYPLNLEMIDRPEVNEYYKCEYDYTKSGFIGRVSKHTVDLSQGKYQLARHIGNLYYETMTAYINNGNPTSIDPLKYSSTELPEMGSDLERIITKGICKVYRPDVGFYAYQMDKDIYWIADDSFNFKENGTYIYFQMNTTQINNLPATRLENGMNWADNGGMFEYSEITGDFGCYRVSKIKLPTDYSLTNLWVGCHESELVWGPDYFYPEVANMCK